jgi:hypothetical protein
MAKLIIGDAPETFNLPVEIKTPNGPATIEFTVKHLLATEWAEMREENTERVNAEVKALFDAERAAAEKQYADQQKKTKKSAADGNGLTAEEAEAAKEAAILALIKPVKNSAIKRLVVQHAAQTIHKIATGWDLEDKFTVPVLEKMCNKYQAAHEAIFAAYNETLEGRRLGN